VAWTYSVTRTAGAPAGFYCRQYSTVASRVYVDGDYAGDYVSGVKGAEFF
jgi:hypothetical protein